MDRALDEALQVLGIRDKVPSLDAAAKASIDNLNRAKERLATDVPVEEYNNVDVVILGSYARQEASGESDFDYLVIPYGLTSVGTTRQLIASVERFIGDVLEPKDGSSRKPGATGLFGTITGASDMNERIGLENDTNLSHSRRVLLIEESVSIYDPALHDRLLRSIFDRYLADYPGGTKPRPPRFLLNDIIRYWYTLAVDYQAKRWERNDTDWGLRYLKLLTSRRLSYASALVPLLLCGEVSTDYLITQFKMPALARLGQLAMHPQFEEHSDLARAMICAELFADFLADGNRREVVRAVTDLANVNDTFNEMRANADELAKALQRIFFGTLLGERSQGYLVF
jgi:predicted nucleotidyltransferase